MSNIPCTKHDWLFKIINGILYAYCKHCDKVIEWKEGMATVSRDDIKNGKWDAETTHAPSH